MENHLKEIWIAYFPEADFVIITDQEYHYDLEDLRKSNWIKVIVNEAFGITQTEWIE